MHTGSNATLFYILQLVFPSHRPSTIFYCQTALFFWSWSLLKNFVRESRDSHVIIYITHSLLGLTTYVFLFLLPTCKLAAFLLLEQSKLPCSFYGSVADLNTRPLMTPNFCSSKHFKHAIQNSKFFSLLTKAADLNTSAMTASSIVMAEYRRMEKKSQHPSPRWFNKINATEHN